MKPAAMFLKVYLLLLQIQAESNTFTLLCDNCTWTMFSILLYI